ncbi:MAG: glycosyltransferase, partial [Clostridiaceae bacterium]
YMLHMIRRKFRIDIPNMAILTDYGSHSMWAHTDIDRYIVADESMAPELTVHGVEWEDILPLGIPVKSSLKTVYDRKETLKEIGLDPNHKTIVLMGGSLAMGNLIPILEEIDNVPMDFNIVVIAANNKKLYDEAVEISLTSNKSITVLGYCNFMNSVMQASDLLITKPGGLTITEAIINGLPMLIFPAIPGQEEQNAKFLLRNNLAYNLESGEMLKTQLISILSDDKSLKAWSEKLKEKSKPDSTFKIVNTIETQIAQYKLKKEQGIPTLELAAIDEESLNYRFTQFFKKFSDLVESNLSLDRILQKVKSTMEVSIEDYSEPDEKDLALDNIASDTFSKIKMNIINKRTWIRNPFEGPMVNNFIEEEKKHK